MLVGFWVKGSSLYVLQHQQHGGHRSIRIVFVERLRVRLDVVFTFGCVTSGSVSNFGKLCPSLSLRQNITTDQTTSTGSITPDTLSDCDSIVGARGPILFGWNSHKLQGRKNVRHAKFATLRLI